VRFLSKVCHALPSEYEHASDQMALISITKQFIFLEEGDIADITKDSVSIFDKNGHHLQT
jgi:glucosamine 6-phosphate synthetase-like amidotransferase/phosphosugar isomerase protein